MLGRLVVEALGAAHHVIPTDVIDGCERDLLAGAE